MALPKYIALKSKFNEKYLRYITEEGDFKTRVQYSAENVVSLFTKYELERAKNGNGLYNIKCCYNNKYWVAGPVIEQLQLIVVKAEEPNEDTSNASCTLFQPVYDSTHDAYRFRHVKSGFNACLWNTQSLDRCLILGYSTPDQNLCDLHVIVDWESLLVLPKHVAFKGDNGKYLAAYWFDDLMYLRFLSDDIGDPDVRNETFTASDGSVRIKLVRNERFWRLTPNWIRADTYDNTSNNKDTLFWPVKVSDNVVGLRNMGNNHYCRRLSVDWKTDCLNASAATITKEARLEIEELVLSREIYNVNFHPEIGKVYGEQILTVTHGDAINDGSQPDTITTRLSYVDSKSSTWNASLSMKLGLKTKFTCGLPIVAEGEIEISVEVSGSYTWGETLTTSTTVETSKNVIVPPHSKLKVNLLASKGYCDVPFSYTQRDVLTDGTEVIEDYDDGLYTGANYYNFKYETEPYD